MVGEYTVGNLLSFRIHSVAHILNYIFIFGTVVRYIWRGVIRVMHKTFALGRLNDTAKHFLFLFFFHFSNITLF